MPVNYVFAIKYKYLTYIQEPIIIIDINTKTFRQNMKRQTYIVKTIKKIEV